MQLRDSLGTATPGTGVGSSTAGSEDVFYNRATGICYIKTGASTWTQAKALTLSTAQKARMVSNMAGLPPLLTNIESKSKLRHGVHPNRSRDLEIKTY